MKRCSKCKKEKELSEFKKDKKSKDGAGSWCLTCHNAETSEWKHKNIEKENERKRKWRKDNPEKEKQHNLNFRLKNIESEREKDRIYRALHLEKAREAVRRWFRNNPEKDAIRHNVRRARFYGGGGKYTIDEWRELCDKYENRCLKCGEQKPLTADHVLPLIHGGKNCIENIQPLCRSCNSSKGTKHIDYRLIYDVAEKIE